MQLQVQVKLAAITGTKQFQYKDNGLMIPLNLIISVESISEFRIEYRYFASDDEENNLFSKTIQNKL